MYLSNISFHERMIISKVADLYKMLSERSKDDYWTREFIFIRRFAKLGFLDRNEMETIITAMETVNNNFDKYVYYKSDLKLMEIKSILPKMKALLEKYYAKKGIKKEG